MLLFVVVVFCGSPAILWTITGDHSKWNLRYTQNAYIFTCFYPQYLVLFTLVPRSSRRRRGGVRAPCYRMRSSRSVSVYVKLHPLRSRVRTSCFVCRCVRARAHGGGAIVLCCCSAPGRRRDHPSPLPCAIALGSELLSRLSVCVHARTHGCATIVFFFLVCVSVSCSRLNQRPTEDRADAGRFRRREAEKSERDQQGESGFILLLCMLYTR